MISIRQLTQTSNFDSSMAITRVSQNAPHAAAEPLYVVVFGYPPDKYSVAVEYFKQLGETTDPDPNTEISNCFRIGFKSPVDAVWAVRKNGEVVGGSWMVGVKWAVRHSFVPRRCEMD
jgi:nuclear pore complex protein Nup53